MKTIDMSEQKIKTIASILTLKDDESIELHLKSIGNEDGTGVDNSKGSANWDLRYNELLKLSSNSLKPIRIKRGWEFVILYNLSSTQLYIFVKKKRLNEIMKNDDMTHYIKLANLLGIDPTIKEMTPLTEQLELFDKIYEQDENLLMMAKSIYNLTPSNVFIFSFDDGFIPSIMALSFNANQELIWQKNYTYLLDSNYQVDINSDGINSGENESSIPLKQKKNIVRLKRI
ncbi:DUF5986 family protein (plasmid) [Jeotgalibaca sp. MA1X17-3]|uniref:DUF5986 family protein n=1 Tax=Jeotgalibaca sp. MA1X17-3 TaxID=2908211 RepID=UPI001F47FCEB|nr:DUF5986 family protein [Jeotgalibaca sp. MA1X17-3]UJF16770.1 DUF5986 family protein [Jeotgalibaca sp. MA1X17-3]